MIIPTNIKCKEMAAFNQNCYRNQLITFNSLNHIVLVKEKINNIIFPLQNFLVLTT